MAESRSRHADGLVARKAPKRGWRALHDRGVMARGFHRGWRSRLCSASQPISAPIRRPPTPPISRLRSARSRVGASIATSAENSAVSNPSVASLARHDAGGSGSNRPSMLNSRESYCSPEMRSWKDDQSRRARNLVRLRLATPVRAGAAQTSRRQRRRDRRRALGLAALPLKTVFKLVATTSDEIARVCADATADANCAGLILWMHTFSPSKMWIRGLNSAQEAVPPFPHPVQSRAAVGRHRHGLHEPQPGGARRPRSGVHPHAHAPQSQSRRRSLVRSRGAGAHRRLDARRARLARLAGRQFCRFGDNMRLVAVTEGDKVSAEMRFGFSFNGYGVGDLVRRIDEVEDQAITRRSPNTTSSMTSSPELRQRRRASCELALRGAPVNSACASSSSPAASRDSPPRSKTCTASTSCRASPLQRLMADGYGFGAEGDWKTARCSAR